MPGVIVMGAQWGDEGKGKAVDAFSSQADYVVRYQGGANAGHTLYVKGKKKILHLIPSGVFSTDTVCVIAAGVAVDIEVLAREIRLLKDSGLPLPPGKLMVSDSATLLMSWHRTLDQVREQQNGRGSRIGTTGRGIGPAYEDRASRQALLFGDIFESPQILKQKLKSSLREKNFLLQKCYGQKAFETEEVLSQILTLREELRPYRTPDTSAVIDTALKKGKKVLFEGAQGSLLDVLHGTYPYVTSSHTVSPAALTGTGIGPGCVQKVMAIAKSYTTRVGEGPFPTECRNGTTGGQHLQQKGEEWGSTTGRKRRCGWLDLVALRYAVRINGLTHLSLMKLDVLSGLREIPVCTAYKLRGKVTGNYPVRAGDLVDCEPVYQKFEGWGEDLSGLKNFKDLPPQAQNYVHFVQRELGVKVDVISVGSAREQTLFLNPLF